MTMDHKIHTCHCAMCGRNFVAGARGDTGPAGPPGMAAADYSQLMGDISERMDQIAMASLSIERSINFFVYLTWAAGIVVCGSILYQWIKL